jgi:recombinational DNA repair protein RecT
MRRKTVLRNLVSRWGNFSPHVQNVIMQDEPAIDADAYELPSDENIVIPEKEVRAEKDILDELGFGG